MKAGWTISAVLHAGVLAWGLIAFATRPLNTPPAEFLATDIISAADFSQLTRGERTAKPAEQPKPLVEKIGDDKPVETPTAKITDKPEIVPTADQAQPKPEPE
jgi:outer membrane biosynthesis protein TonB